MRVKYNLALVFITIIVTCFGYQAFGDFIPPGTVAIKTVAYQPGKMSSQDGIYRYSVSWEGIPVGRANITIEQNQIASRVYIKTETRTAESIEWIYKLRHQSESLLKADTFRPVGFLTHQVENSKDRLNQVTFQDDGKIISKWWKDGKEKEDETFTSDNFTLDPISAAYLAKSLPIEVGSESSFDVYNGKHRYLITFSVTAKEKLKLSDNTEREAFKVVPTVKKLTDSKGEKRIRSAALWISADDRRDILRLESRVLIGRIIAQLVSFTPKLPSTRESIEALQAKVAAEASKASDVEIN